MKEKSDKYQTIPTFKSKSRSYVRQFEARNTERIGFTQRVEYRGEDIDVYIPIMLIKLG